MLPSCTSKFHMHIIMIISVRDTDRRTDSGISKYPFHGVRSTPNTVTGHTVVPLRPDLALPRVMVVCLQA